MTKGTKKALIVTGIVAFAGILTFVGVKIYNHQRRKSGNQQKDNRTWAFNK